MSDIEVALADLGEIATRELAKKHKPYGMDANIKVAKSGGKVADNTRKNIEELLGEKIVTSDNMLDYEYKDTKKLIEK